MSFSARPTRWRRNVQAIEARRSREVASGTALMFPHVHVLGFLPSARRTRHFVRFTAKSDGVAFNGVLRAMIFEIHRDR